LCSHSNRPCADSCTTHEHSWYTPHVRATNRRYHSSRRYQCG
jgi:hypothetical protein